MIQKKVCMLGAFAVGKTSLVARYVHSIFSDKYLTTIGVKIDKKPVSLLRGEMELILWDIYGEDEFQKVRMSYLQGASAYLLVADGTRRATLEVAASLQRAAEAGDREGAVRARPQQGRPRGPVGGGSAALEQRGPTGLEDRADQREDRRGRRRGVSDPRARDGIAVGGTHEQRCASGGGDCPRDRRLRTGPGLADSRRGPAACLDGRVQPEPVVPVPRQLPASGAGVLVGAARRSPHLGTLRRGGSGRDSRSTSRCRRCRCPIGSSWCSSSTATPSPCGHCSRRRANRRLGARPRAGPRSTTRRTPASRNLNCKSAI